MNAGQVTTTTVVSKYSRRDPRLTFRQTIILRRRLDVELDANFGSNKTMPVG